MISGVMIHVLALSVVDHGFESGLVKPRHNLVFAAYFSPITINDHSSKVGFLLQK
jgi:hypothetical protein